MPIFKTIYGVIAAIVIVSMANVAANAQSLPFLTGGTGNVSGTFYSYAPATNRETIVSPSLRLKPLERAKDPYYRGLKAYRTNDFKRARKLWKQAAAKGHIFALWRLANLYRFGKGTKVDNLRAFKYYRRVARQHINDDINFNRLQVTVDSIVKLGHYHLKGIANTAIKADPDRAFALYQLAATHYGHSGAQLALGRMYLKDKAAKRQIARGIRWINLAARKNNAKAQATLGNIYWSGTYVRKNQRRALTWYILASQSANKDEAIEINEQMIVIAGQLSEKTRKKARQVALAWRKKRPLRKRRQKVDHIATITPKANVPSARKSIPAVRKAGTALKIKPPALK